LGRAKEKKEPAGPLLREKGWAKGELSPCAIGGLEKLYKFLDLIQIHTNSNSNGIYQT
jgi:hypothetical protein